MFSEDIISTRKVFDKIVSKEEYNKYNTSDSDSDSDSGIVMTIQHMKKHGKLYHIRCAKKKHSNQKVLILIAAK